MLNLKVMSIIILDRRVKLELTGTKGVSSTGNFESSNKDKGSFFSQLS